MANHSTSPTQSATAAIVCAWPKPVPGFHVGDDGTLVAVLLFAALFEPATGAGSFIGVVQGDTGVMYQWTGAEIALDEGVALNVQASRRKVAPAPVLRRVLP